MGLTLAHEAPSSPAVKHPPMSLARHLNIAERTQFRRGQVLFAQGQRTDRCLFWIQSGRVKFSLLTDDGLERVVAYAGDGAIFGEESIVCERGRLVMCEAVTDVVAYVFERTALVRAIHEDPDLAVELLESMATKLRMSVKLVEEMSFLGVRERVAHTVARLASGEETAAMSRPGPYVLRVTHQELASLVGASRVMVSNALADLVDEGLIEKRRGYLVVRDALRLFQLERGENLSRSGR